LVDHPRYTANTGNTRHVTDAEVDAAYDAALLQAGRDCLGCTGTDDDVLAVILSLHHQGRLAIEMSSDGLPILRIRTALEDGVQGDE
jgi:hypothetical protein